MRSLATKVGRPGGGPRAILSAVALFGLAIPLAAEEAKGVRPAHGSDSATARHRFSDAKKWSGIFEHPSRDAWQKPKELVAALGLVPGDRVADIGAGTGYFLPALAGAVGPAGTVFLVEVEKNLVEHMRKRAEKTGHVNAVPILGSLDNPRLPAGSVDLVLLVDTYHHIDARKLYFRELRKALTAKGRLAVVDFHKRPLPIGPKPAHKLEPSQVVAELEAAGWTLEQELPELLPYQYVLFFAPVR